MIKHGKLSHGCRGELVQDQDGPCVDRIGGRVGVRFCELSRVKSRRVMAVVAVFGEAGPVKAGCVWSGGRGEERLCLVRCVWASRGGRVGSC